MNRAILISWLTLGPVPVAWRLLIFTMGGAAVGMAVLVLHISRATSYLSDTPETCLNCHVMEHAYASWRLSSHGRDTTCTDCHLPHQNPVAKLARKGRDGLRHAYVFTFRLEPQVLHLASSAVPVVQEMRKTHWPAPTSIWRQPCRSASPTRNWIRCAA